jgi:hypothetical protein
MVNNEKRNLIRCSTRPFDCEYSNPVFTGVGEDHDISEHFCDLSEVDCIHAYMDIKDERREKLNKIKDVT